jgi:hypothetical protein
MFCLVVEITNFLFPIWEKLEIDRQPIIDRPVAAGRAECSWETLVARGLQVAYPGPRHSLCSVLLPYVYVVYGQR